MKAKQLLLHIGSPKTGTTTLQETLLASDRGLRAQGVIFSNGALTNGNAIKLGYQIFDPECFEDQRKLWLRCTREEAIATARDAWEKLVANVHKNRPDIVVISSENFMCNLSQAALNNAKNLLGQIADEIKIVAYLRAPAAGFLSLQQQRLKITGDNAPTQRAPISGYLDAYRNHLSRHISLRVFDRAALTDGDIVADFCKYHLPQVDPRCLVRNAKELNSTMSAEAMAIFKDYHNGDTGIGFPLLPLRNLMQSNDALLPNPTNPQLTVQAAKSVTNWYAPELIALRDSYGVQFEGVDYDQLSADDYDPSHLNYSRIEQICHVDAQRKARLLRRLRIKSRLPAILRKWSARW